MKKRLFALFGALTLCVAAAAFSTSAAEPQPMEETASLTESASEPAETFEMIEAMKRARYEDYSKIMDEVVAETGKDMSLLSFEEVKDLDGRSMEWLPPDEYRDFLIGLSDMQWVETTPELVEAERRQWEEKEQARKDALLDEATKHAYYDQYIAIASEITDSTGIGIEVRPFDEVKDLNEPMDWVTPEECRELLTAFASGKVSGLF